MFWMTASRCGPVAKLASGAAAAGVLLVVVEGAGAACDSDDAAGAGADVTGVSCGFDASGAAGADEEAPVEDDVAAGGSGLGALG